MMTNDDEPPVYPLMSYATGIADDAVALSFELATDLEEFETREGSWLSTAMTPDNAIELGKTLIELGERLKAGGTVN